MYTVHTETLGKYTLKIEQDDCLFNPYEDWDFFGTLVHWHRRGFIGEDWSRKEREDIQEFYDNFKGAILPVYLYEHGGQTISTEPFSCPWDSGQVGFIYADSEKVEKEFSGDIEKAKACLKSEVKTLDDYLRGNVWDYSIEDSEGDVVESRGGFYGDYDGEYGALSEGRDMLAYLIKADKKERCERLKTFIKNRVPLQIRAQQLSV